MCWKAQYEHAGVIHLKTIPHEAINLSKTQPARAVVARNDPAEQDKVEPYEVLHQ